MSRKLLSVPARFFETVDRHDLVQDRAKLLVAVSGGADSVALLDLARLGARERGWQVWAYHLNHRLRPAARQDERFVRRLCREWRVPLAVGRGDVAGYARRHRLGLEEAGREVRLRRLEQARRRLGCDRAALGHTADDNLETVILNLVRGTGLHGLCGIPVRRGRFVRPLLDLGREELREHLRARGVGWAEDESNLDVRFRRNLVRLRVVPVLKELNPGLATTVRRTCELLLAEDDLLAEQAAEGARRAAISMKGRAFFDSRQVSGYNSCLTRRMLRQLVPELDADGTERVLALLAGGGGRLELAAGVRATVRKGVVEFTRAKGTTGSA